VADHRGGDRCRAWVYTLSEAKCKKRKEEDKENSGRKNFHLLFFHKFATILFYSFVSNSPRRSPAKHFVDWTLLPQAKYAPF
jgi:hypothetical protein